MIFASTMLILACQMATIVGRSKFGEFYVFVQNICATLRIEFFLSSELRLCLQHSNSLHRKCHLGNFTN
jgi:hypothetical protein